MRAKVRALVSCMVPSRGRVFRRSAPYSWSSAASCAREQKGHDIVQVFRIESLGEVLRHHTLPVRRPIIAARHDVGIRIDDRLADVAGGVFGLATVLRQAHDPRSLRRDVAEIWAHVAAGPRSGDVVTRCARQLAEKLRDAPCIAFSDWRLRAAVDRSDGEHDEGGHQPMPGENFAPHELDRHFSESVALIRLGSNQVKTLQGLDEMLITQRSPLGCWIDAVCTMALMSKGVA